MIPGGPESVCGWSHATELRSSPAGSCSVRVGSEIFHNYYRKERIMTIRGQHGKRHLYFHAVLVFAVIFTTALTAAGLSGDQTGKHKFELRLASHEKVEGWERVPGPGPSKTPVWISPEAALTNRDVARAWPDWTGDENKPCVGILLTEDGALKLARLTKLSHRRKRGRDTRRPDRLGPQDHGCNYRRTSPNTRQLY